MIKPSFSRLYLLIICDAIYSYQLTLTRGYNQVQTAWVSSTLVGNAFGSEPPVALRKVSFLDCCANDYPTTFQSDMLVYVHVMFSLL